MDNTKTYIKMCEKAGEIQPCLDDRDGVGGTWVSGYILYHTAPMNQPHNRDGYYYVTDEIAVRRCEQCGNEEDYIKSSKAVWLPRQDQLQEMVKAESVDDLVGGFYQFVTEAIHYEETYPDGRWISLTKLTQFINDGLKQSDSMEQLWLAYVMSQNYNKIWNGEEWKVVRSELCP